MSGETRFAIGLAIRQAAHPADGVALHVRAVEQIADVGDAVPIDDRGHARQWRARALAIETGAGGNHRGRQREVTAGGVSGRHDASDIEVVGLGVLRDPSQRAQAILDRRRRLARRGRADTRC